MPAVQQAAVPTAPDPPPLPRLAAPAAANAERPIPPPDPALLESSPHGPVPRVGPEGRTSIRAYARAFDRSDTRPRIALVVGNLGLSASLSEEAIRRLPPATTLAFSPYAFRPGSLLEQARARGMEVLTALPLEPAGYPLNDPGERGLLTGAMPAENADRLLWVLARIQGQVGAIGALGPMRGERFAAVPDLLNGLQDSLRARGLLYLDPRPGAAPPARSFGRTVDIVVDEPATRGEIERRLAELERLARERGAPACSALPAIRLRSSWTASSPGPRDSRSAESSSPPSPP
ncbi:divergent polysaccharide deacetylase family protein [Roseomonas sp. CCTCC AB2023176]|uniref:divergent polysaccharide deacetylase family protein n=1 Tax=Roseomonas sp. CCTCC AB2023176 TaxID=3342640 RepID=UPI0035E13F52